jgi:uncharacterized DUF497 family protein
MLLEFDEAKSARNVKQRGIGFERFADIDFDAAVTLEDRRRTYGGQRKVASLGLHPSTAACTPR